MHSGAVFSTCGNYRFNLWRIWDELKPTILFIGYNPSTANASTNDLTTKRIIAYSQCWGFGGVYLLNCFPRIATNPKVLMHFDRLEENDVYFNAIKPLCSEVIFAWGNFNKVTEFKRDGFLSRLFPEAKALAFNKNGSPKHPLYTKSSLKPVLYTTAK